MKEDDREKRVQQLKLGNCATAKNLYTTTIWCWLLHHYLRSFICSSKQENKLHDQNRKIYLYTTLQV